MHSITVSPKNDDRFFLPFYYRLGLAKAAKKNLELPPPPNDWKQGEQVTAYADLLRTFHTTKALPTICDLFSKIDQKREVAEKFYALLHSHNKKFCLPPSQRILRTGINANLLKPPSDPRLNFAANLKAYTLNLINILRYFERAEMPIDQRWVSELYPEFVTNYLKFSTSTRPRTNNVIFVNDYARTIFPHP